MRTAGRIPKSWYESPWRIAGRAVSIALVVTVLALIAALLVVPRVSGGGSSLTVLTGSMQPTLAPGDLVAVRGVAPDEVCTEIGVGDIVTYLPEPGDPTLITHRVVGKTVGTFDDGMPCRLITQGDANSAADAPVSPVHVRGAMLYSLPALGWVRQWAVENIVVLGVVLGAGLLGYGVWNTFRRPRTRVTMTSGSTAVGPAAASATSVGDSVAASVVDDLRIRELDLRERELAVREEELRLARLGLVPFDEDPLDEGLPHGADAEVSR
ncbi:signal peptidase I [Microbacterium foliorum]